MKNEELIKKVGSKKYEEFKKFLEKQQQKEDKKKDTKNFFEALAPDFIQ